MLTWGSKMSGIKIWSIVVGFCVLFGGIEAALTLGILVVSHTHYKYVELMIEDTFSKRRHLASSSCWRHCCNLAYCRLYPNLC